MSNSIPTYEAKLPSEDDTRLKVLFDEMSKKQVEFLDEAGKRIIEMVTVLLGLLIGIAAFDKDFPPPYLKNDPIAKIIIIFSMVTYILAMLAGFMTVQPRQYRQYFYNLTLLESEFRKITQFKLVFFRIGSILFFLGSLSLVVLICRIILIVFP
jgi:hypothetical protein